jgi:UDP-N-acetylmuramate--alanine ligase
MKDHGKTDSMHMKVKRIHFVGIGGIGMSGIAEVLLNLGYTISGSDLNRSDTTMRLESLGAAIFKGHDGSHLTDVDVVVTSTAVRADNPEVLEAHRKNIPVIPRAEMLAELLKMKFSIAVSGSHGKTTTTSMISTVLAHGGLDPTMVIGGKLANIGSNAKMGDGKFIVAEADESDGSFLKLSPSLAVITNIDREHLDYYRDIDDIKKAFLKFANSVPFYGSTILCADDENVQEVLPQIKRKTITYGINRPADYRATDMTFTGSSSGFSLHCRGESLGSVRLNVPGLFNIYNAMAAIAAARELDLDVPSIKAGLELFTGVHRRMEVKGHAGGITVIDDYGHHPTEIRATLAAARHAWPGKIIVVFQPHRYTRTRALFDEFLTAFSQADALIVTDIYAASEEPIPGVNAARLCEGIRKSGHKDARYLPDFGAVVEYLLATVNPSDSVITLGAGTIWKVGEELLKSLKERGAE